MPAPPAATDPECRVMNLQATEPPHLASDECPAHAGQSSVESQVRQVMTSEAATTKGKSLWGRKIRPQRSAPTTAPHAPPSWLGCRWDASLRRTPRVSGG